jgi:hypothetical protein
MSLERKPLSNTDKLNACTQAAMSAAETADRLRNHANAIQGRSPLLADTLREVADEVEREGLENIATWVEP